MEPLSSKKKTGLIILGLGAAAAALWYASSEAGAAQAPSIPPLPPSPDPSSSHVTDYPNTPQALTQATSVYSQRGDSTVQLYQQRLLDLGYDPGPIDGLYGSFTRRAVMDFQRDHSLTVDGILGPRTKAAIDAGTGTPAPTSGIVGRKTMFWRA